MSETTTVEGGASPPEPADDQLQQDNQAQANDNQVEANDNAEQPTEEQQQRQSREDRRIAQLSARLAAETRERERLQAEAESYRQRQQPLQLGDGQETEEQREQRMRQQVRAEVEAEVRRERFHQEGQAEYGASWTQKCSDLMAMGADPMFAALVVEMPDAVKVTAALADDPEAVQRIAGIRSERGRAIALGRYAASLERQAQAANDDRPAAPPPRVTAAPAPVRPVTGGRAAPAFDPYNPRHTPEQLVDYFMRQDQERRVRRT